MLAAVDRVRVGGVGSTDNPTPVVDAKAERGEAAEGAEVGQASVVPPKGERQLVGRGRQPGHLARGVDAIPLALSAPERSQVGDGVSAGEGAVLETFDAEASHCGAGDVAPAVPADKR